MICKRFHVKYILIIYNIILNIFFDQNMRMIIGNNKLHVDFAKLFIDCFIYDILIMFYIA